MKITNYLIDSMVYASILGKSLFLAFGKGFLGFCKIFTPVLISIFLRIKSVLIMSIIIKATRAVQAVQRQQCSFLKLVKQAWYLHGKKVFVRWYFLFKDSSSYNFLFHIYRSKWFILSAAKLVEINLMHGTYFICSNAPY